MNRDDKVQIVVTLIYAAVLLAQDKEGGFQLAARWYLRGAHMMRDLSNWAGTTAIRWENAARTLVAP